MGQRETPARVRADLGLAQPAADLAAETASAAEPNVVEAGAAEPNVAEAGAAEPNVVEESAAEPSTAEPDVSPAAGAAIAETAPKRSPSVPPLPLAALERPTQELRAELTPSPVPLVSLMPPTSRISSEQLAELNALESLPLPAVAPRPQSSRVPPITVLPTPAFAIPLVSRPRPPSLARRLANDVRSSKREIALGLVIGIVLSFVVGKLGQSYLESRSRGPALVVQSFANEPAPANRRPGSEAAGASAAAPLAAPAAATPAAPANAHPPAALPITAPPTTTQPAAPAQGRAGHRATSSKSPSAPEQRAPAPRAAPAPAHPAPASPAPSAPLSPAENAGLGLQLPL